MNTRRFFLFSTLALVLSIAACSSSKPTIELSADNPVMEMRRTQCFGRCPAYKVEFRGDGTARYTGYANVDNMGVYIGKISNDDILALVKAYNDAEFFSMNDEYDELVSDVPSTFVSLTLNGKTKNVKDRFGAPEKLKNLERAIDAVVAKVSWKKEDDK